MSNLATTRNDKLDKREKNHRSLQAGCLFQKYAPVRKKLLESSKFTENGYFWGHFQIISLI